MSKKGIIPKIDFKRRPESPLIGTLDSKVIFLNKENLAVLEGYKALVEYKHSLVKYPSQCEIHIILTGFSSHGADRVFDALKEMAKNEVYGK